MTFECPNGHQNYYTYSYWRKHKECPICKSNKYYKMNDAAPLRKGFRILAFDQASITSGWSVYDGEELIKFGDWTSNGVNSTDRIAKTKAWFAGMVQAYKPDLVVLEDIQLQKFDGGEQVLTYKKLAHLQGVLENYCYENGYIYKVVPAATWRAASNVKGKTRSDRKRSAQLIIKDLYDLNVTQDVADAILIGKWAVLDQHKTDLIIF